MADRIAAMSTVMPSGLLDLGLHGRAQARFLGDDRPECRSTSSRWHRSRCRPSVRVSEEKAVSDMRLAIYYWNRMRGYLLGKLAEGQDVVLIAAAERRDVAGISGMVPSDVEGFLFHIDLTHDAHLLRPEDRRRLIDELSGVGIGVINGGVVDISKRAIQCHNRAAGLPDASADRAGPGEERLIVKTDLNSGGNPEYESLGRGRNPIVPGPGEYRILARRDIPDEWWTIEEIEIERFVANEDREFYRFHLLGNRVVVSAAWSEPEIKRMDGTCPQEDHCLDLAEIADLDAGEHGTWVGAARTGETFARSFGLGYGAIDIMRDDLGRFFVIDVNKTPYWGADIENAITVHLRSWLTR
jgi:hypothetical protein